MRALDPRLVQGAFAAAAAAAVLLSWRWGYQQAAAAYHRDAGQAAALKARIDGVEPVMRSLGGEEAWLAQAKARLQALKVKFPKQTQLPQLLNALVETLKAGEIRLVNVVQGNLEPVLKDEQPLSVEGVSCYRLPVTITAEGRYYAVLEAIERLRSASFPSLVSIGQVELRRRDAVSTRLDATIQLFLYVFGGPTDNG